MQTVAIRSRPRESAGESVFHDLAPQPSCDHKALCKTFLSDLGGFMPSFQGNLEPNFKLLSGIQVNSYTIRFPF